MTDKGTPRLYSIPSSSAFVDTLAAHILQSCGGDSAALPNVRVLLPTRRACRALQDAFLRLSGGGAVLLPRLTPLGDVDEDEITIADAGAVGAAAGMLADDMPPAISGLRRQMLLARAVMAMPDFDTEPDQAAALALELARLLDRLATERCDPAGLKDLVSSDYAEHWQEILKFLEIITDAWPRVLDAEGAMDSAARRNLLLEAQARLWRETAPEFPVIAAGSTGSIPATAELLGVIAGLPKGEVILPGLDMHMDDEAWSGLGPTHPQYGLKQLLGRLHADRGDVKLLSDASKPGREALFSTALRPGTAKPVAPIGGDEARVALADVHQVDCPSPAEEAAVIALIMRHRLETPGKTCALVTPDRSLARRVAAALKRWDLNVDDSAGVPLGGTPPGAFLRLVADVVRERLAPVALLSLLKHPLCSGGMATPDFRTLVRQLERLALRGPRPAPGLLGLRSALAGAKDAGQATALVDRLADALEPMIAAFEKPSASYGDLVQHHISTAEALAATDDQPGAARLWVGDAGEAAATFVQELTEAVGVLGPLPPHAYPGLFEGAMSGRAVRPRFGTHPRLFIWGLLEARLQHADTVILGGLNESVWPPEAETNPWMSRPMMATMGLEPPERRIGLTAHDFQQAFAAPEVYLTRAYRVGGAPTVPSRWLQRLENLLTRAGARNALMDEQSGRWLSWSAAIDTAKRDKPSPPKPCPPADARPAGLSATRIETLIRDPYSIYARYILRLKPLDPIDADPGAADRGNIIHGALDQFISQYPDTLPDDAERRLIEIGRNVFGDDLQRPGVRAFWWPRFERIAHWFVDWQRERLDAGWRTVLNEERGVWTIDAVDGGFEVSATPDRIDYRADSGLSILDYKTGQPPTAKQVASGLAPQLPLEALIALAGKFPGVPDADIANLAYVHVSGGREPGKERALKLDLGSVLEDTRDGVTRLVVRFADAKTPYISRPRPQYESRFGDYDHLARVLEWGGGIE